MPICMSLPVLYVFSSCWVFLLLLLECIGIGIGIGGGLRWIWTEMVGLDSMMHLSWIQGRRVCIVNRRKSGSDIDRIGSYGCHMPVNARDVRVTVHVRVLQHHRLLLYSV